MLSMRKLGALASIAGRRAANSYDSLLVTQPIVTKACTAVVIAAAGDIVCQSLQGASLSATLVEAPEAAPDAVPFDVARVARFASFAAIMTPLVHAWLLALSKRVRSPVVRVLWDQLLWAPIGCVAFLVYNATLQGSPAPLADALAKAETVLYANWAVWPMVQLLNFSLVPQRYQVLVVSGASFFWSIFLSFVAAAPSVVVK
jgi:hypothetical protein